MSESLRAPFEFADKRLQLLMDVHVLFEVLVDRKGLAANQASVFLDSFVGVAVPFERKKRTILFIALRDHAFELPSSGF